VTRPRDEAAARTRAALVAAGIELFTRDGFAGVSTVRLCEHVGVTRGALYHHFANLTALMEACFEEVDHALVRRLARTSATGDPGERLRACTREFVRQLAKPSVRAILFVEAPAALGWARWRELDGGRSLALVRELLADAHGAGMLRPGHDPAVLAHLLLGALNEAGMFVAASRSSTRAATRAQQELDALLTDLLATGP
jgi:AcrR family transcriptional regulator